MRERESVVALAYTAQVAQSCKKWYIQDQNTSCYTAVVNVGGPPKGNCMQYNS